MTWRHVALYWLCFVGLSAYYLAAVRRPAGAPVVALVRAPFLAVSPARINGVELQRGAARVRCQRSNGRWRVVEPAGQTVPSDLVAALVNNVSQLPDVQVVAENSRHLKQFGLDPPLSQIRLVPASGDPVVVKIGSRNPAGTAVYAQRTGSQRVFLIGLNVRYYEDLVFEAVHEGSQAGEAG